MSEKIIGVIGGTGRVGREVVRYLVRETPYRVLMGGRRAPSEDREDPAGRVDFMTVDLFQEKSLAAFCDACDILVNCAGPSSLVGDRVAMAALEHGAHYVDPGGHNPLYQGLAAHEERLREKGLAFVLAVGILPGLSEVFPIHEADLHFDAVHDMEYHYIGRDRWTRNSAYDIAWGVGHIGKGEAPVMYEAGRPREVNLLTSGKNVDLPDPVGRQKLFPVFREELRAFVEERGIAGARVYGNNWGRWVGLATIAIRLLGGYGNEKRLWRSAGLIVRAAERDLRGKRPGFLLHLRMRGTRDGIPRSLVSTLYFEDTYRATGVCAAIAARLVAEGGVPSGRRWASLLPDIAGFMTLFRERGYEIVRELRDEADVPVMEAAA